jgi:hypothetical protein
MAPRTVGLLLVVSAGLAWLAISAADSVEAGAWRSFAWAVFFLSALTFALLALVGVRWAVSALVDVRSANGDPAPWAVLFAAGLLLAVAFVGIAAYFLLPAPTSATTLINSLEGETGSAGHVGTCRQQRGERWRCSVNDSSGSGQAGYAVIAQARCWRATRYSSGEAPMPANAQGCTTLRDLAGFP